MADFERIKERLQKLSNLAEYGATPGERENARERLQALLEKYNLTREDVKPDEKSWCKFSVPSNLDKSLLFQIVATTLETNKVTFKKRGKTVLFELTSLQYADIAEGYAYYRKEMAKDLEDFQYAFFLKHGLLAPASGDPVSEADLRTARRAAKLAKQLNSSTLQKPLPALNEPTLALMEKV